MPADRPVPCPPETDTSFMTLACLCRVRDLSEFLQRGKKDLFLETNLPLPQREEGPLLHPKNVF